MTIYAFSLENFNRSKEEVDTLFALLRDKLKVMSEHEDLYARYNKVRIRIIGNRSFIPEDILKDLENVEETTKDFGSKKTLNVCFPILLVMKSLMRLKLLLIKEFQENLMIVIKSLLKPLKRISILEMMYHH